MGEKGRTLKSDLLAKSGAFIVIAAIMIACSMFMTGNISEASTYSYNSSSEDDIQTEPVYHPVHNLKAVSDEYRTVKLTWTADDGYEGGFTVYKVVGGKLEKVGTTRNRSYNVRKLTPGKKYYFKVKSDTFSSKVSATVIVQKTASLTLIKSGKERWDVRKAAGQKTWGYDTIQGACAYGGYAYMALYNRDVERIKIVKVNLKTMKVVKISKPVDSHCHGNTLTYNPKTNRIIAVCGKGGKKKAVFVNADTLKQTGTRTFSISDSFIGEEYKGIAGLAYNKNENRYIVKIRSYTNKIISYSSDFKTKKRIKITKNESELLPQGLYTEGGYMYDVQSFKNSRKYNMITIRTLGGTFVGKMKVRSGTSGQLYELENLFYDETADTWYVSFYRANVKTGGDTDRKNYLYKLNNLW